MAEREKVIKAIGCCLEYQKIGFAKIGCRHNGCIFIEEDNCVLELLADILALLKAQEPRVLTLEQASGRDYCFYEYRATGYVEPASVVISGMMLGGAVPLAEVYRLGREGAACVAVSEYGRTWRCWDRMPEDGEKEAEPWES